MAENNMNHDDIGDYVISFCFANGERETLIQMIYKISNSSLGKILSVDINCLYDALKTFSLMLTNWSLNQKNSW